MQVDALGRDALIEQLQLRWERPFTQVYGGAGYGKTTLLRQVMDANATAPRGLDVAITLSASLAEAPLLAATILDAFGRTPTNGHQMLHQIVDAITSRGPAELCLVLDDLHHLPESSSGAALVRDLIASLPANGHILTAGRLRPPFRTARLRALGHAKEVGQDALGFSAAEVDRLAALHGRSGTEFAALGSWPALLSVAVRGESTDGTALLAGVARRLDGVQRRVIGALLVLGNFDGVALARALGVEGRLDEVLVSIPLVQKDADGEFSAHDLWSDVIDTAAVDESALPNIVETVRNMTRMSTLFDFAAQSSHVALMKSIAVQTLATFAIAATPTMLRRWSDVLEAFVDDDDPVWLLLEGALLAGEGVDHEESMALLRAAQVRFEAIGNEAGEAAALGRLVQYARVNDDETLMAHAFDRATALSERWPQLQVTVSSIRAAILESSGDYESAIRVLDGALKLRLDRATRVLMLQYQVWLAMFAGRIADFRGMAEENALREPERQVHMDGYLILVDWFSGVPTHIPMVREDEDLGLARNRFVEATNRSMFAVSLGAGDLASNEELAIGAATSQADAYLIALVRSAAAIHRGDEPRAAQLLADAYDAHGPPRGPAVGQLLRFGAYPVLLCPQILDDVPERMGPEHANGLAVARCLEALRNNRRVDWSRQPGPGWFLTSLPLAWSVEIAVRAQATDGGPFAIRLSATLNDYAAEATERHLARFAVDPALGAAAKTLLGGLPVRPSGPVQVRALGTMAVCHPTAVSQKVLFPRTKVMQLLVLLVARPSMGREEIVEALWPDRGPGKGANNLRTTLSYLRSTLEPGRAPGRPSAFILDRAGRLELLNQADLWFDLSLAVKAVDERRGTHGARDSGDGLPMCVSLVDMWQGPIDPKLWGVDKVDSYLSEATDAAAWAHTVVAEAALARDQPEQAVSLISSALELRPNDRRALRLAVVGHRRMGMAADAVAFAQQLVAAAGAPLDETSAMICRSVGVEPQP